MPFAEAFDPNPPKQLTVLGGYGFVGSHFCDLIFSDESWQINDKCDYSCLTPDVINFVSTVSNYNVLRDPWVDIETNLCDFMSTLESWRVNGAKGIYNFVSSWFVYGDTNEYPASENAICNPKGFYSITKRCAEQLLISYCETYGLKYRILRLANVVGPGDKKISKEKNAVMWMLKEIKENRDVNVYDGGNIIRDFIYVSDCVNALDLVLDQGETNTIYNISNGFPIRVGDILEQGKEKFGSTSTLNYIEIPKFHRTVQAKNMYLNNSKLVGLGYRPISAKITIEELLGAI